MRIAICDDDERELAHLLGLIKEYRLSRRKDIDCRSFQNSTERRRIRSYLAGHADVGRRRGGRRRGN